MVDRKLDLLLECDFVSLFLVEFFVHEYIEIKQSWYQLSVFSKKMAKEKRKKTAKTKKMDVMVSHFAALLKS